VSGKTVHLRRRRGYPLKVEQRNLPDAGKSSCCESSLVGDSLHWPAASACSHGHRTVPRIDHPLQSHRHWTLSLSLSPELVRHRLHL